MNFEHITLNILIFVFGYFTCRTFYFFRSVRRSIVILKLSQVVSLSIFLKCIEEYSNASAHKLIALNKCGILSSDPVYQKVSSEADAHIEEFKARSVSALKSLHSGFFETTVEFNDWSSAMAFLKNNRKVMETFFK